jgi:tetratricopeptide (TPR) repeat protein
MNSISALAMAAMHMVKREYPQGLALVDGVLRSEPTNLNALQMRGFFLIELGRTDEAIGCSQWILHYGAQNPESYALAAGLYAKLRREADTVAMYDAGIRAFPRYVDLYEKRGSYLAAAKHYQAAVQTFDAALQFASDHSTLWYNRGCAFARMGQAPPAVDSLRRAIALQPSSRETAKVDGDYAQIKDDPAFRALVGL